MTHSHIGLTDSLTYRPTAYFTDSPSQKHTVQFAVPDTWPDTWPDMEEVSGIDAAESVMWTREDWPEGVIISYGTDAICSTTVDGDGGLLNIQVILSTLFLVGQTRSVKMCSFLIASLKRSIEVLAD